MRLMGTGAMLLAALGVLGICGGAAAAGIAEWFPSRQTQLERWGGRLVIMGLTLVGLAVPLV